MRTFPINLDYRLFPVKRLHSVCSQGIKILISKNIGDYHCKRLCIKCLTHINPLSRYTL